jgi:uncharacterized SAM-binding protein YcdF (DUF218 family)
MRLIAVLGYSAGRETGIHAVCARRLAHAQSLVDGACAVLLSGEADLMREAWTGATAALLSDPHARNTAGNAAGIAAVAREIGATDVVVVTSRWHTPRAAMLLRAALKGTGISITTAPSPDSPGVRVLLRELACFAAAPFQAIRLQFG